MSYSDEHVALCALNKIFGYHPALAVSLLEQAGSAVKLFAGGDTFSVAKNWADAPEKVSPSGQTASASLLSQLVPSELEWARKELERVEAGGFRFVTLNDEDYPVRTRRWGCT